VQSGEKGGGTWRGEGELFVGVEVSQKDQESSGIKRGESLRGHRLRREFWPEESDDMWGPIVSEWEQKVGTGSGLS
jgi:hypothetical protein